ncbi:hypothetical protein BH10PSE2_BH10PSE2_06350 [soil metagenome]
MTSARHALFGIGLLSLLLGACATTPYGAPVRPQTATAGAIPRTMDGYLTAAQIQALADAVPPPHPLGSPEAVADAALSDRYRAFENSDRWLLATAHAELGPDLARQHFDCALGVRFAATPTPRLTALFQRLLHDANGAAELAKTHDFRPRPVGVDAARAACVRIDAAGRSSPSYPSGSAAVGTAYAEALALIAPDRAADARRIGHEIGISRLVCAMHYPADIGPGEAIGRAVVAEAASTTAFRDDILAAQGELAQVRAFGLTNPGCVAARAALAASLP